MSAILFSAVLILAGLLRLPRIRGMLGEFKVNLAAQMSLDPDKYVVIPNVTLSIRGRTAQIDHLIISQYGVFVIETKNMRGWIYGSADDKNWTQVLYRSKKRFLNPLRQNHAHVRAVAEGLRIPTSKIFPLVVFVGDATFKTTMPDNVFRQDEFVRYIKSKTKKLFSRREVRDLVLRVFERRVVHTQVS